MGASEIKRYERLFENGNLDEFLEIATLGQLIGLLDFLRSDKMRLMETSPFPSPDLEDQVGVMILNHLLSQGRKVDHREHRDMIAYLGQAGFTIAHLKTGEGDVKSEKVSIERKEDDFMTSLFDDRRLKQLGAMREEADHSFLIITKSYNEVKQDVMERDIGENILVGYIASLCAIGYPPLFISNKYDAARIMKRLVSKLEADTHGLYVRRPKKARPSDYRNAIFETLPGVGPKLRRKIAERFLTIQDLAGATVEELQEIDGVGNKTAERIYDILHT
tara:strand:+ start:52 stop:882 length:831 start_codon:yes stop_codon:yes gene_type:complete